LRISRRLAQPFNLHAIDIKVLANHEVHPDAAGDVSQFRAQIRVQARPIQLPQARAFPFRGIGQAGLNGQLRRILFQHGAGFGDHAHFNDPRRLIRGAALRRGAARAR
jgi:hypothetical protein